MPRRRWLEAVHTSSRYALQTPSESRRAIPTIRSPSRAMATCCDCSNDRRSARAFRPLSNPSADRSALARSQAVSSRPSTEPKMVTAPSAGWAGWAGSGYSAIAGVISVACGHGAFVLEQPALALEAAAVAGERAGRADQPVTRNDDGDRVVAVGVPHRPRRARTAEVRSELAVGAGLAVGDVGEGVVDAALERGPAGLHREVECSTFAREVPADLLDGLGETVRVLSPAVVGRGVPLVRHEEAAQHAVVPPEGETAERALDRSICPDAHVLWAACAPRPRRASARTMASVTWPTRPVASTVMSRPRWLKRSSSGSVIEW